MHKRKVFFIGNRSLVFERLLAIQEMELVGVVAQEGSYLHRYLLSSGMQHEIISRQSRDAIFQKIRGAEFDLLVSNGCPFILPISELQRPGQLYINIHPSLLPNLRGKHPVNGALLKRYAITGATMHYMDDGIDTGSIIYQEEIGLTDDIDLGLLYQLLFDLEAIVFEKGMRLLRENGFVHSGKPQADDIGDDYSRQKEDMVVDFAAMSCDDILTRIRAFGVKSQGVQCRLDGRLIVVFDAERMTNPYVLRRFADHPCGTVLLSYDEKFIVKSKDGIIKIRSYLLK